jgi:hypothetical protein
MTARLAAILIIGSTLSVPPGPGPAQDRPPRSTFAGEYRGPYTTKGLKPTYADDRGKYTISITADGRVTGTTKSDITGDMTTLAGSVAQDGKIGFTVKYRSAVYTMRGILTKTRTGGLRGTLLQYSGKEIVARDEIDLSPK